MVGDDLSIVCQEHASVVSSILSLSRRVVRSGSGNRAQSSQNWNKIRKIRLKMASRLSTTGRRTFISLKQVASTSFNRRFASTAPNVELAQSLFQIYFLKILSEPRPTKLFVSVMIERLPLITTDMTPMEKEYAEMCDMIDLEQSYLNDDEVWRREHEWVD